MFDDMNCPCNLDFGLPVGEEDNHYAYRAHPKLIEVIERLGKEANGELANIKIVEVPEDIEWGIGESEEGYEWVYEEHRTWE